MSSRFSSLVIVNADVRRARRGVDVEPGAKGQIVLLQNGLVHPILTQGLQRPFRGGLAVTPGGRFVVFGNEHAGLWAMRPDGSQLYRLVRVPRLSHSRLGVEGVAVSSRGRLAYAVNRVLDTGGSAQAQGIWLTRFHPGSSPDPVPRKLVTLSVRGPGVPNGPITIRSLSWSRDDKTLIAGAFTRNPAIRSVVPIDASIGADRVPIGDAGGAAVSPATGDIAYVNYARYGPQIWLADAAGRHQRVLIARGVSPRNVQLAWSPDGRQLAYIGGPPYGGMGTTIHVVNLASHVDRTVLRADVPGRYLLSHGYFAAIAWLPVRGL